MVLTDPLSPALYTTASEIEPKLHTYIIGPVVDFQNALPGRHNQNTQIPRVYVGLAVHMPFHFLLYWALGERIEPHNARSEWILTVCGSTSHSLTPIFPSQDSNLGSLAGAGLLGGGFKDTHPPIVSAPRSRTVR